MTGRRLLLLTTILLGSGDVQAQHNGAGSSGMAYLKLGVSGRAIGMADAVAGHVSGAPATFYNPAGLVRLGSDVKTELMFAHKEWIQDTRTEFLGAAVPVSNSGVLGFSMNSTTVSDIEIRTRPGPPEALFTARSFYIGASYALAVSPGLGIGITGKFLYEKILVDESSGYAADVGVQWTTPVENLSGGLILSNLGSVGTLRTEKTKLPSLLRLGVAYAVPVESMTSEALLAADIVHIFPEKGTYLSLGGEFVFDQSLAARAGYQFGSEGRGFSAGLGVTHGLFGLDYAFSPIAEDLGTAHTFSLSVRF